MHHQPTPPNKAGISSLTPGRVFFFFFFKPVGLGRGQEADPPPPPGPPRAPQGPPRDAKGRPVWGLLGCIFEPPRGSILGAMLPSFLAFLPCFFPLLPSSLLRSSPSFLPFLPPQETKTPRSQERKQPRNVATQKPSHLGSAGARVSAYNSFRGENSAYTSGGGGLPPRADKHRIRPRISMDK